MQLRPYYSWKISALPHDSGEKKERCLQPLHTVILEAGSCRDVHFNLWKMKDWWCFGGRLWAVTHCSLQADVWSVWVNFQKLNLPATNWNMSCVPAFILTRWLHPIHDDKHGQHGGDLGRVHSLPKRHRCHTMIKNCEFKPPAAAHTDPTRTLTYESLDECV